MKSAAPARMGPDRHGDVALSGYDDRGHALAGRKPGQHFEPLHAGHADIGDEAALVLAPKGFHECLGAGVGSHPVAGASQHDRHGLPSPVIVVYYEDRACGAFRRLSGDGGFRR
jgi:hypothetical protein